MSDEWERWNAYLWEPPRGILRAGDASPSQELPSYSPGSVGRLHFARHRS